MGRFVERMRAVGARRAALIVVIAAVVAVGLYFGVWETGVSERTEAGAVVAQARAVAAAEQSDEEEMSGQGSGRESDGEGAGSEPLTLTLSAPLICEARYPKDGFGRDGKEWWSWASAGTMEVSWVAAGGDGSYTVTIVGETYTGASGSAEVSCALEHGPVSTHPEWGQIHAADDMPLVDSGPKTVSGRVVDGSGATATASVDVYAVLNRGLGISTKRDRDGSVLRDQDGSVVYDDTLEGGKTYRIDGVLMTVPSEVDLVVGERMEYSPGSDDVDDRCCSVRIVWIAGVDAALVLWDTYEEASRVVPAGDAVNAIDVNRVFDEFLASFGQPPKLPGGAEPLTLTLSAAEICETATRPKGGSTHGLDWNEEEQAWEDIVDEAWWYWDSVGTMEVIWSASGGDGAYTVTIATETYTGASGTAEVSCAMQHGPIIDHPKWGRIHVIENPQWGQFSGDEEKPVVEPGVKTITATVVDGTGATAEASIDVYALINRGFGGVANYTADGVQYDWILKGGTTYRIDGILMTVPAGVDLDVGGSVEYAPGVPDEWDDDRCCTLWHIGIVGSEAVLYLYHIVYEEHSRYVPAVDTIGANRVFDEFLASFGQPPKLPGGTEPLTLTLSAPEICETEQTRLWGGEVWDWDKDEAVSRTWGWRHSLMYVDWTVSGGEPPYTLTIDGESRDEYGDFSGTSGTALVSCALTHGPAVFWTQELMDRHFGFPEDREDVEEIEVAEERVRPRHYPEDEKPHVDSGPITISATVADSRGVTAEAAVDAYVILLVDADTVMNSGKTYRVNHTLVTVPLGLTLALGGHINSDYEPVVTLRGISHPGVDIALADVCTDSGCQYRYVGRWYSSDITPDVAADLDAKLDQLAASLGQPPSFERGGQ